MKKFSAVKKFLSGVGVVGMMTAGVGSSVFAGDAVHTLFQAEGACSIISDANGNFDKIECKDGSSTKTLELKDLTKVNPQSCPNCPNPENWTNMGYTSLVSFITGFITIGAAIGAMAMNFFGSNK